MGSKNSNGRRKTLALLAATTTLAGGLTAGTAWAGGGGDQGGTGGGGSAAQFWAYKDDATGSWGSATDLNSVSRAMAWKGVTMDDSAGKAAKALSDANAECVAGFRQRHPGEGDGDCRVVAVGAASGNGSTTSVERVRRLRREDMEGQLAAEEHRRTKMNTFTQDLSTTIPAMASATIRRTASTRSWHAISTRPAASS